MEHEGCAEPLDDFLDGGLTGPELAHVTDHLRACARCRAELDAITSLRTAARGLPREIAPSRDLWGGIAARIAESDRTPGATGIATRRAGVERARRWAPLAAAAVLVIVVSSGLTVALLRTAPRGQVAGMHGTGTRAPASNARTAALAAFRPAELEYERAIESLQSELDARRGTLAPETVVVIEANLAIIDQAIAEARAALESDPSSTELPLHLSDIYGRKLELLRSAIQIRT